MDVILFIFRDISRHTLSDFMRVTIISEVGVVRYNEDWVFGTFQEVVPMF